jgi:hypothetical protein
MISGLPSGQIPTIEKKFPCDRIFRFPGDRMVALPYPLPQTKGMDAPLFSVFASDIFNTF